MTDQSEICTSSAEPTQPRARMSRQDMQTEALVIETLLDAAMAMHATPNSENMIDLIEMAQGRANRLNSALDSVNAPEGMQ